MTRLVDNAHRILETAELGAATQLTILMRGGRPFAISTSNDWSLAALLRERQAEEVFRISRRAGQLTVEGRSRAEHCLLSRQQPLQLPRLSPPPAFGLGPMHPLGPTRPFDA